MAEERERKAADLTVAQLRQRASELEITGRSSMNKEELVQAVVDAEEQLAGLGASRGEAGESAAKEDGGEAKEMPPASSIVAPSIGPHTVIDYVAPEDRLDFDKISDVDAMGLDKRRKVVGKAYSPSLAKQATLYGAFLAFVVALLFGGKLLKDELDAAPAEYEDLAPWSQADAPQVPAQRPQ